MRNDNFADAMNEVKNVAENFPGGFFICRANDEKKILYANEIVLEIFGCKTLDELNELTNLNIQGFIYDADREAVTKSIKDQLAEDEKKIVYVEYRIIRKDGSIRWVYNRIRLVNMENFGEVYYVFIRDITHQYFSREESKRREKVIEGLSIGFDSIYFLNLKSGSMKPYRLQNDIFLKLVEELNLKETDPDWRTILPEYAKRYVLTEDRDYYLNEISFDRISKRLQNVDSYTFHYRCSTKSDEITHIECSIVKIKDEKLNSHVVMGYRDVTEQISRVEKELAEKLSMELALEKEKHSNEIKASFLFNVSHDIRTPMNAIMGFTALSKNHINEPELLQKYLDKLDESNRHMLALIDDLLEMSKIDYGRIELKNEACDLNEQIEMVIDMFNVQAEEKKIIIDKENNLPAEKVFVDSLRFRRIMANLISNAIKFTAIGGKIKIKTRQKVVSESGYARYEFSIQDNGVGMTEEFMQKMFEAFEREETSTRSGYIGTGLGLSITKKLLDMMGGSISVKSKKGEGSIFTVDLPLKIANNNSESVTRKEELKNKQEYKSTGKHRILLVEDIDVNRMLAETILTESGFLVESVVDGCDAVEAIKDHPLYYYDLVLMDIQMPVMNGYEATRSIRALKREDTNFLPIIALSANAREQDKKMSLESGMNSHVAKPFDIAHLISTINEHISRKK